MSIIGSGNALLLASAAAAPVVTGISRSLRFNSADSAYLNRTPASAGNRRTFTLSCWVKVSNISSNDRIIFGATNSSGSATNASLVFAANNALKFSAWNGGSLDFNVTTTSLYRDTSAWYHFVLAVDTTQATASNRVKIYVNGSQVNAFSTANYPSQNYDSYINNTERHTFGIQPGNLGEALNAYLADIHFIDGQALDPTSFGEFDATTGVWNPIEFVASGPNDGTTWSSSATGTLRSGSSHVYAFNGTIATNTISDFTQIDGDNTYTFSPSGGIPSVQSLKAWVYPRLGTLTFSVNGSVVTTNTGNSLNLVDLSSAFSTPGTLNSLQITSSGSGSYWGIAAIEVNGVTLIDGDTSNIGVNGFHLPFSDNSGTSSTTLGKDAAGSNNWTPNNFSVASGPGNDSLVDVPQNGDQTDTGVGNEVRGNYLTWNPLSQISASLVNGNLDATITAAASARALGTFYVKTGKWYWEVTYASTTYSSAAAYHAGVATDQLGTTVPYSSPYGWTYTSGFKYHNGSGTAMTGSSITNGDVAMFALDADAGKIWFGKNGTWFESGVPGTGTNPQFTTTANQNFTPVCSSGANNCTYYLNAGARAFAYSAPSNFKALCNVNLPTPTIEDGSAYMDVVTYTGNGSTQTISGLGFSPDWVWIKGRSIAADHGLFDIVRGTTKRLVSNATQAEDTQSGVTAFNSDGFSLGSNAGQNNSGSTYAAWCWDGGSSTVSNTDGSITSSVRANTSAGFSVATFTKSSGTSTTDTVGHGLNAAPYLIITKQRNGTEPWYTYHQSLGNAARIQLNETSGQTTGTTVWGSTSPTSSVFSIRNVFNGDYVAYCFAPVAGYSAFGSYTGNGSTDGPFVFTGFRPRWVLFKRTNAAYGWLILDTERDTVNVMDKWLEPNVSSAESTIATTADFLSNGFKLRNGTWNVTNASGGTYIYAAFAESPQKYARAR